MTGREFLTEVSLKTVTERTIQSMMLEHMGLIDWTGSKWKLTQQGKAYLINQINRK